MDDYKILDTDGYIIIKNLVTKEYCKNCIDYLNMSSEVIRKNNLYSGFNDKCILYELLKNDKLNNVVKYVLGEDYNILWFKVLNKCKWVGQDVEYHQELIYNQNSNIKENESFQLFLALDDHNLENGCLNIIPKSHLKLEDYDKFIDKHGDEKYRVKNEILTELTDKYSLVNCIFETGDCIFFKDKIIHGSASNASNKDRYGLAISFIKKNVTIDRNRLESSYLDRNNNAISYLKKLIIEKEKKNKCTPTIFK